MTPLHAFLSFVIGLTLVAWMWGGLGAVGFLIGFVFMMVVRE